MQKLILYVLCLVCLPVCLFAQLDSLLTNLSTLPKTPETVDKITTTAFPYWSSNPEITEGLGRMALEYSQTLNYDFGKARAYHSIGIAYMARDVYDSAVDNYLKALAFYIEIDDKRNIANINMNIGNIYDSLDEFEKAVEYIRDALKIFRVIQDTVGLSRAHNNIGVAYNHLNQVDSAISNYQKSIFYRYYLNDTIGIARITNNVAVIHLKLKEPENAIKNLNYVRKYISRFNDGNLLGSMYANYGEAYLQLTKYGISAQYLDSAFVLAKEIDAVYTQLLVYEHLTDLAIEQGQLEKAVEYLTTFNQLDKEVRGIEVAKQIEALNVQYETEKKEKLLAQLEKEKVKERFKAFVIITSSISTILVCSLIIYVLRLRIRNSKLKERELKIELEQKNKELTSYALNFLQKNELIGELSEKLDEVKKHSDPTVMRELTQINKIVNDSFRIDQDWENFKLRFEEVHTGFFVNLKDQYPELGNAELRLCALLRLNLNLKESSRILGISPDSVKTARYRLRKKLNLEHDDNLVDFLIQFEQASVLAS